MDSIGITGVTGHVGGRVRDLLSGHDRALVLLARDPSKVSVAQGQEVRSCDFAEPDAAARALQGVDTLLMVSASEAADRLDQHPAFVAAAPAAGVRHLVYTTFQGAAPD